MRRYSLLCVVLCFCLMAPAAFSQDRYVGSLSLVPYNFAPRGSALCNGQLLPISQNTALFSLIGTYYGGDGRTTFALPDLRGRIPIGQGQGPGLTSRDMGEIGGEEQVTLTVNQMPSHSHNAVGSATAGNTPSPTGAYWAPGPRLLLYSGATSLVPMNAIALGITGGSQPHDNLKPYLTLNYVIWLTGIFPPRS
jgi:microcystin-dependent protein